MSIAEWFQILLHVDQSLEMFVNLYGTWVYAILFAIIFCETGLVVFPFLPGDTLLFVAGALCAMGNMNIWMLFVILIVAAIAGNSLNYAIGQAIGQKAFTKNYRWLDKQALEKTQNFYRQHGGKTIILARFVPVVRTFAPFVAGISRMSPLAFQWFNTIGAIIWVLGLVTAGYFFGNIPVIRDNLSRIVLLGIAIAVAPLLLASVWKMYQKFKIHRI